MQCYAKTLCNILKEIVHLQTLKLFQTCKSFFTTQLLAIDFHSILFPTMEVSGYHQLFDYQHSTF